MFKMTDKYTDEVHNTTYYEERDGDYLEIAEEIVRRRNPKELSVRIIEDIKII